MPTSRRPAAAPVAAARAQQREHDRRAALAEKPDRYFDETDVIARCGACNFAHGATVKGSRSRETIARLEEIIWRQDAEIARLTAELAGYENGERERPRATPRIY
jgi:hypothetical protein